MFGEHKGHDVSSLDDGYKQLQERVSLAFNHGHLKVANHSAKLIQVKHTILLCDDIEDKLTSSVKKSFEQLRALLDNREKALLALVSQIFVDERGKLEDAKQCWEDED